MVFKAGAVVTAGVALVALAACGGGANNGTAPLSQAASGLANLDPCKEMTSQQLSADGLPAQGTPQTQLSSEPGCDYQVPGGETFSVYKNQQQTVDSYQTHGNWDTYQKITVNGRPAARAQSAGSKGNGVCQILMDAGGGIVYTKVTALSEIDQQACGDALKYAQQIEPSLPK